MGKGDKIGREGIFVGELFGPEEGISCSSRLEVQNMTVQRAATTEAKKGKITHANSH